MKLILDTHAFIWSYSAPRKLPASVREALADSDNEVFISAVTFWEISIKIRLGKLQPIGSHPSDMLSVAASLDFTPIPISPEEAAQYGNLKEISHKDPFDRMLVWQAISRNLVLVSRDTALGRFKPDGLRLMWK